MLDQNLVLKGDELFLAGEISHGERGELATGLYLRDTRHLSCFAVTLGGRPLETLTARVLGPADAVITGANPVLGSGDDRIMPLTIAVEQRVRLAGDLRVQIHVHNHSTRPVALPLAISLASDFRDLFDIRGFPRAKRGTLLSPTEIEHGVRLAYRGLDDREVATEIRYDQPADLELTLPFPDGAGEAPALLPGLDQFFRRPSPEHPGTATATFDLDLSGGQSWTVTISVTPRPATGPSISERATLRHGRPPRPAHVGTDHVLFNRFLDRSREDLLMLQTSFPEGSLPAAGIPWYVAPFGRDSLIVGLQTVHFEPDRAAGILRVLAALQGDTYDPWRDEEPGKILHEVRYGEMARLGEVPHTPYYGSVDATPLFVMLFAETVAWSWDEALYQDLLPNVRRALDWIEGPGDIDGDGFVEYQSKSAEGVRIIHQGWKDSVDSLHQPDGTPVTEGPIALVEVQGYVYAAYRRLAEVARLMGDADWAAKLHAKADSMRERVEAAFWMEDAGFYAQALDAEKRPVRTISSNPGHLLWVGLPSVERAERVAARLLGPEMFSGWGVRTLSAAMATYNPMSYHNGSVWPHDNSLIAAGLRRYGCSAQAQAILNALFEAANADHLLRLPELYSGFPRAGADDRAPVPYPVSCSPQAWAAAAAPLLVATMLGLRLDLESGRAILAPDPPPWIDEVTVHGMLVRGTRSSFTVRRSSSGYASVFDGPIDVVT